MDISEPTPVFGKLAADAGAKLLVGVCRSRSGFYLGTTDSDGLPFSRESVEYWIKPETARRALDSGRWTQRRQP